MQTKEYDLETCVLRAGPPAEVGRACGHFWFSSLHHVDGEDVFCEVCLPDDKPQGKWPAVLYLSRDGGCSWRKAREIDSYGPSSTPMDPRTLLLMPFELWPLTPGEKRNVVADGTIITCSSDGAVSGRASPVKFLGFPRDLEDYHEGELYLVTHGNILPLSEGLLLTTVYGRFVGETSYACLAVVSGDGGLTWRYRSTVACGADVPGAPEGPNESSTVILADGRLMCAYRVGSGSEHHYHKSYSTDGGVTWTRPEQMMGLWSVQPRLARLANGLMLLSGGRTGLFLWVCADGRGDQWARLNLAEHHNSLVGDSALRYSEAFCEAQDVQPAQSTSYTGIMALNADEALICYDRLANGWGGAPGPGDDQDIVFCVRVHAVPRSA